MHVLKSKWVLTVKLHPDGSIKRVKARFVACGYSQIEGWEYTEVFAKNLTGPSFRLFSTQRTRHFERSETMFKRYYMLMLVHPHLVSTVDMVADIFTKALDRDKFYKFRNALLNIENGPHELDAMNGLAARAWAKLQRHMFSP